VTELGNESTEYREARARLLEAEIALKDQGERVAELRRRLPGDTRVGTDYVFEEGPRDLSAGDEPVVERSLTDLFEDPSRPLVLMQFMLGGKQENPCPMCTMWADGYDGVVPHLEQNMAFALVVAGDLAAIRRHARARGWKNVRLLSSQGTSFKRDFGMEDDAGAQFPGVSVFSLRDGEVRHLYTQNAMMAPKHFRGIDLLTPVYNLLDLTPEGRGDWMPKLVY
jgi:predicted dithiol-disulfide oxidoreductase (DUF899 family)